MYQLFQYESEKGAILFLAPSQCTLEIALEAANAFKGHLEKAISEHKEKSEASEKGEE